MSNESKTIYDEMIEAKKTPGKKAKITIPVVIRGLKFIAENPDMRQQELVQGLIDLGCIFTCDDLIDQFKEDSNLLNGMRDGNITAGALFIVNTMHSNLSRSTQYNMFLKDDNDTSIYHFIRESTGNENYTKANIELMLKVRETVDKCNRNGTR